MDHATATGDGVVQIAYLHPEHVSHSWHDSMRRTMDYDRDGRGRIALKPLNIRCGSGRLVPSRNFATRLFLDRTEHEWMLFIDTDMGWEDDAVHRLLAAADPVERPVVGALCFAQMETGHDGAGGWRRRVVPTMYRIGESVETGTPSFCFYGDYIADVVTRVAGTGAAFLLMHRSVLDKVRAEYGDHWWDNLYDEAGDMVGEDIAFCARLLRMNVPVHVHTGVRTTHHKHVWLDEEDYVRQEISDRAEPPIPYSEELPTMIHPGASLATLVDPDWGKSGMLKTDADLARYAAIIEATKPEVIVETGTRNGASAAWFAELGVDVITIDVQPSDMTRVTHATGIYSIIGIEGDSADAAVAARVTELVAGRRCMVSLDSDHSAAHVAREIELYGPLVSPGCYLVVEDGIFAYAPVQIRGVHFPAGLVGSPLDAIATHLHGSADWSRDVAIERTSPVSHHPAGWWVRNA